MKFILSILFFVLNLFVHDPLTLDRTEAQNAFVLLNKIRQNPESYYQELQFNPQKIHKQPILKWNDTLAKVAERKALDMAKRNYFDHVDPEGYGINYFINKAGYKLSADWLKNKSDNYFESLQAGGDSGEQAIKDLIIDRNTPSKGHRSHLLGGDEWNASLKDIGIGFAYGGPKNNYHTYVCVIIAKHD